MTPTSESSARLDLVRVRERLQSFDFQNLFVEELGWSRPKGRTEEAEIGGVRYRKTPIAELAGVVVLEIQAPDGDIPLAAERATVLREISRLHHENLLLFVDANRARSLWVWGKRDGSRLVPRDHPFVRGQTGDLFLGKLAGLVVELAELDGQGKIPVTHVARKLRAALDVERVTRRFFEQYELRHQALVEEIVGLPTDPARDRRWYASVLLNRLMFVTFLQKKGFLDRGDFDYLRHALEASGARGENLYFRGFLRTLFFEGFAKPFEQRSPEARALLGEIRYLNGGLFLEHRIEIDHPDLDVPDQSFAALFDLFDRFSWHLDDTPGGADDEINPDVLGSIFEKYINQKAFGAYYTRPEITGYLCEETIHRLILDRLREADPDPARPERFDSLAELLLRLDARQARLLLLEILPKLSVLDPACGSGAFLVAAQKTLLEVYSAVLGFARLSSDATLRAWLKKAEAEHPSLSYYLKKRIVTENLFGVDVMEEAVEIARLRLFLALVASARTVDELEPLPNVDFNLLAGNSLVGLLHVDPEEFAAHQRQADLFRKSLAVLLEEKNRLIGIYRHATTYGDDLRAQRDDIEHRLGEAREVLDDVLLARFTKVRVKVEEATWDDAKGAEGKPKKRPVTFADVRALEPFHWGYELDDILDRRGGFDVVLTNPPWETWKPQAKEFFAEHSSLVTKNKMSIEDFEKEKEKLLANLEVRAAWLAYQARFPHVSQWFRKAPDYEHQTSEVGGRKTSSDLNLYKLFLERAYRLLRPGGRCGILLPTGVYTDLGAKGLRELLFGETEIDHLFGLSNERFLFDGVDHRFRICLLTFRRGNDTQVIRCAFRMDPREAIGIDDLDGFLHDRDQHLEVSIDVVRRLSPDTLSLLELKNPADLKIVEKMLQFPLLGERIEETWNLSLGTDLHMTNDSDIFRTEPGEGRLPLLEGKMIHQFDAAFAKPKYWVDEAEGRKKLLGREKDEGQTLGYQSYRLAYRDVARNSDERTMIAAILPPGVFCPHTVSLEVVRRKEGNNAPGLSPGDRFLVLALLNSFVFDYLIRPRVTAHVSFFLVFALCVPRLHGTDPAAAPIVERAARLTCVSPAYADLWRDAMGTEWTADDAATGPAERARLRAEIDARVARLYGLNEEELRHVLATFPVVAEEVKAGVLAAWRGLESFPG